MGHLGSELLLHPDNPIPGVAVLLIKEVPVLQPGGGLWQERHGQPGSVAVDPNPEFGGNEMPEHAIALRRLPRQQANAEDQLESVIVLCKPPFHSGQLVV
jgi:hypothetical protein